MKDAKGVEERRPQEDGSAAEEARRTRRASTHGILVAIDAPEVSSEPWVVDAIDLSAGGLGLVLPPELLDGTRVRLSFKLGDQEFSQLPARVLHRMGVSGGVQFEEWPEGDRLRLLEYVVGVYESGG